MFWVLLQLHCLVQKIVAAPETHFFSLSNFIGSEDETPRSRTAAVVEQRAELGRLVLLLCTNTCVKHRSGVPLWVKEFNQRHKYDEFEAITYYYHTYKQPLPFFNESTLSHFPNLIYFIAQKPFPYNGDVGNKRQVMEWLGEHDWMDVVAPTDHTQLDDILSGTSNCSNKYLVIANTNDCPVEYWANIARVVSERQIIPVRLQLPLPLLMNVVFFRRLPLLDYGSCQFVVLVYEDGYSELTDQSSPSMVREWVDVLLPQEEGDCPALMDVYWQPIKDPLTELQLIYFSEEQEMTVLNHRQSYVLVGLTGGVAVIVLATSIFWGLNGSAFAR